VQGARTLYNQYGDAGLFLVVVVMDGSGGGDPTQEYLGQLADSAGDSYPFIADTSYALYNAHSAEIILVAPGGEVVAGATYASELPVEEIEALLY
jgi:hypothetical protein